MSHTSRWFVTSLACLLLIAAAGCSLSPEGTAERAGSILANPDPLIRAAELGALLAELPPEALPALQQAFRNGSIDRGDTEVVLFATWWARFDPEGARAWTLRDWTAGHLSVGTAVFRTWAESDPKAAWQVAQDLLHPVEREVASNAVIVGWHDSGRPGLRAHLNSLSGALQQKAGDALARRRTVTLGPAEALAWVDSIQDREYREFMAPRVAGAAAWLEPETAAAWAQERIDDSYRSSGLARRVATRWVRTDPEATMTWLSGLPAGGDRDDGVMEAYRDWLAIDRGAAVSWMDAQEVAPWLEPALALHARGTVAHRDPVAALELAGGFADLDRRHTTSVYIARSWLEKDREAAERWLEQSDLPHEVVRRAQMTGSQFWERKRRRDALEAERRKQEAAILEGVEPAED